MSFSSHLSIVTRRQTGEGDFLLDLLHCVSRFLQEIIRHRMSFSSHLSIVTRIQMGEGDFLLYLLHCASRFLQEMKEDEIKGSEFWAV